jgi:hypothetical protein
MAEIHASELGMCVGEEFVAVDELIMIAVDPLEPTGQRLFAFWLAKRTAAERFGVGAELDADKRRALVVRRASVAAGKGDCQEAK